MTKSIAGCLRGGALGIIREHDHVRRHNLSHGASFRRSFMAYTLAALLRSLRYFLCPHPLYLRMVNLLLPDSERKAPD